MKYKPGDKFIITLGREISDACMGRRFLVNNAFFLCEDSLDALEPYEDQKQEAYQRGLKNAWEAARKIYVDYTIGDMEELYGCDVDNIGAINPQEAIAKLRAYEEAREIHVGDEVKFIETPWVVTSVDTETRKAFGMTQRGKFCGGNFNDLKKTGRHFPEVDSLLKKMKDNADV